MDNGSDWMSFIERVGVPASVSLAILYMHYKSLQDIAKNQESISKTIEHVALHILGKNPGDKND
jgi:hypothetical protein